MKKTASIIIIASMALFFGCKKEDKKAEYSGEKKYAKYRVAVHKDMDLKEWLATLEKSESVEVLKTEEYTTQAGKKIELASIRLTDGKQGYTKMDHLAEKPMAIIDDNVKAYQRPDIGSTVIATIPKGTVAFIIEEKGEWTKIYIGNLGGKWITGHWIKGGFSLDENMVQAAKEYEAALAQLAENKESSKNEAKDKLTQLSNGTSVIAELARKKMEEIMGVTSPEISVDDAKKAEDKKEAIMSAPEK